MKESYDWLSGFSRMHRSTNNRLTIDSESPHGKQSWFEVVDHTRDQFRCVQLRGANIMHMTRGIVLTAIVVISIFQHLGALSTANHKEADEAKAIVDSLSKKLHGNLVSLEDNYDKTRMKISKTIKDLAIVKKVQDLLSQLNNGHVHGAMCEHGYIVLDFCYKQNIMIETRSALPVHYTITVQGTSSFQFAVSF